MSVDDLTSLLDGRILLGNQKHAKNLNRLESLNVTHILACGFQEGFHESLGYVHVLRIVHCAITYQTCSLFFNRLF